MVCRDFILPEPASYVFFYAIFNLRNLLYIIKWSAPADCFRCKVRWDRRASVARGAAPCTERSDAKQPGHLSVRAVCLAERTYSRQESIEVRPLFQRDISSYSGIVTFNAFSYIPIQTYPISRQ